MLQFRGLTFGFQNTTGVETLVKCLDFLHERNGLYPGEGHSVLQLLNDVFRYINRTLAFDELHEATETFYKIVDLLLKYRHSMTRQEVS